MAENTAIKECKKCVEKVTNNWSSKLKKNTAEIKKIDDELAKLGHKLPIKDYAKLAKSGDKKVKDLVVRREAAKKKVAEGLKGLETEILASFVKTIPPYLSKQEIPKKELLKLPKYVEEIIKRKGIPFGKYGSFMPDISIDPEKKGLKMFKKVGVTVNF